MPNTTPPIDRASMVLAGSQAAEASGSPVRLLQIGSVTAGRAGEQLAPLGELADAGVVGFSDDGSPVQDPALFRNALAYAAMLGLPLIDHPEDLRLTSGAEANDGLVATVLGLRGWPAAAEAEAVARDIALLAEVVRDNPGARLHLTHLSTPGRLRTCAQRRSPACPSLRVTPHHLALTDEWLAGARRWAWEALDENGVARDPWRDRALVAAPYDTSLRVNPPLRSAAEARACLAALADGTVDAIATDHAPHTEVDKAVEFGAARPGIAGIETALGVLLEAVDAGLVPLARVIAALTVGPARVLGSASAPAGGIAAGGIAVGALADLVVFDRGASWNVRPGRSRRRASGTRGRSSADGRGLLTIAAVGCLRGPAPDCPAAASWSGSHGATTIGSDAHDPRLNTDYERRPYWHATMPALPDRSGRDLPDSTDVVVIGGGYTGLAAARKLAEGGSKVVVLESRTLGWGASTRNGGIAHPGYKWGPDTMVKRYGRDLAARLYGDSVEAVEFLGRTIRDNGIDADLRFNGYMELAWSKRDAEDFEGEVETRTAWGTPARVVPYARLGEEVGTAAYHGGLAIDSGGVIHPARGSRGSSGWQRRRARTLRGVRATAIRRQGDGRFVVETERGAIPARDVLVATNPTRTARRRAATPDHPRSGRTSSRPSRSGGPGARAVADRARVLRYQEFPVLLARERGPPPDLGGRSASSRRASTGRQAAHKSGCSTSTRRSPATGSSSRAARSG